MKNKTAHKAPKKPKRGRKPNPPPLPPVTEQMLIEVRVMAYQGMKQKSIADFFGISQSQFAMMIRQNEQLASTIKQGQAQGVKYVGSKLMELVEAKDLGAIRFYLKTRGNMNETAAPEEPADSSVIPEKLPSNPIDAARVYREIMLGGKKR